MGTPASKQTLDSLVNGCKGVMDDLEKLFPTTIKLRYKLKAIGADEKENSTTLLALLTGTHDLLMGNYLILHELASSLRLLIDTSIPYEKRYHIQRLNLSLCEAFTYYSGENNDGIWSLLKPKVLLLDDSSLNSYVDIIDLELNTLGAEFCDRQLRNSTAHFDQPIKRYKSLCSITEEEKYCMGISQFFLVYSTVSSISTKIFSIIHQYISKNNKSEVEKEIPETLEIPTFDIKDFVEKTVAEKLASNEQLEKESVQSLTKISSSVDSLYKDYLKLEGIINFSETQKTDLPSSVSVLRQLILLRMMVAYIRCDLTCAIRAYLNSKSNVERSLHLSKIYLIEVSALTHLYGYNTEKKSKSVWSQLMAVDDASDNSETKLLQKELEEQTEQLDSVRRNLHTHYREGENLNIVNRYEAYKELNQVDELTKSINLLHLCGKIENYTMLVMSRIQKKQQQESIEWNNSYRAKFDNLRTMVINSKAPEETKTQNLAMLEEIEKKLFSLINLKSKT